MRRQQPDTRFRWNDPDLPVWYRGQWVEAAIYQKLCQLALEHDSGYIHYSKDESYDWKEKAKAAKQAKEATNKN